MPADSPRPALVIAVLASCGLAVSLMQTLVVPLLPRFPGLLDAAPTTVAWLVTATLVAGAVCAPVLGRLGDMYGKRRMLVAALGLVAAGSALGAVAPGVEVLLVARVLQGASLGVVPLGLSIMRDELPAHRVGGGIALMSSSLGIGGALGLPLTGLVADHVGWRWLFAGAAVLATVQLLVVRRLVAESPLRTGGRFDLPGAFLLATALVGLLLVISKGGDWGWTSGPVGALLTATVVVGAVWIRRELSVGAPLVDLRISARPAVLWTNVASILVGFAMFASFMLATQVLQAPPETGYGFGLALLPAGLALLPIGAAMTIFSPVSARLSKHWGPRSTLVLGAAVLAAGNLAVATLPGRLPLVIAAITVVAAGAALAYSALPLIVMAAVPPTETAAANSLNTLMRMLGTSACSAVAAAATSAFTLRAGGLVLPAETAYTVVFLAAAGAAVVAGVIASLTPHPAVPDTPTAAPEATRTRVSAP